MTRVCVVGGGAAGIEAASEAARNGAEVTLLERSERLFSGRRYWLEMIRSPDAPGGPPSPDPGIATVEVLLGIEAVAVDRNLLVRTSGHASKYDRVIFASGTKALSPPFPGSRKPGVFILDEASGYLELGERRDSVRSSVVCGGGLHSLLVAAELSGSGRRATLLCPGGVIDRRLGGEINRTLGEMAANRGISILDAKLERAVGTGMVEAAVAGGVIVPCDVVAVVPERVPNFPSADLKMGPRSGIMVDSNLKTSVWGCYAAGGCAEFEVSGISRSILLGRSARASGRVAGANASGQTLVHRPVGTIAANVFGIGLACAGFGVIEARTLGLSVVEAAMRLGPTSACSVVSCKRSGRTVGVQLLGKGCEPSLAALCLIVSQSVDLRTLSYADLGGSTDISLVAETARQGLSGRGMVVGQDSHL